MLEGGACVVPFVNEVCESVLSSALGYRFYVFKSKWHLDLA